LVIPHSIFGILLKSVIDNIINLGDDDDFCQTTAPVFTHRIKELYNCMSKPNSIRRHLMGFLGFIFSLAAAVSLLVGLIPLLGWLNWITTLPAAILGAVFSGIGLARSRGGLAVVGLIISVVVFFLATGRLIIGCGVL
jgi:hypothetical protein